MQTNKTTGIFRNPHPRTALTAIALLLMASEASAFLGDSLDFFVGETVTHDSNIFRISKDRDAQSTIGSRERGDTYATTIVGLNLDLPVSRQRFLATASWNRTHHERFKALDFTGRDVRLLWMWQGGDALSGQLGYRESKTLASLSDIQTRLIDPVTTRRLHGTANYLITPNWELTGGLARTEQKNEDATRAINNIDVDTQEAGFNYVSTAGNRVGLSLRHENGRLSNRQIVGLNSYDNSYNQRSAGVTTDWTITAKSRVRARLDRVHRDYRELSERNWTGTTARVTYDWRATEKLTVTAEAQRDLSVDDETRVRFVLVKGISLRPDLALTEKTRVGALFDYSTREYLGEATTVLGVFPERKDKLRVIGANLSYTPLRKVTIQLQAQRERRTSNVAFGDYDANVVSLNARIAF